MVYIFLADGFEEIETITPIDILKRAGIDIKMISISDSLEVCGAHGITMIADETFDESDFLDAEMLILPGGKKGTENLAKHDELRSLIIEKNEKNKYIAAICAAPAILGQMGLLQNKTATCYPGNEGMLKGAKLSDSNVVSDGNIITSRGPGTAQNFGLRIVKMLKGKEIAEKLNESMLFKRRYEIMIKEK
ncbi:MAG: thiamine biosynthesis protein ThiJ [Clostridiales bacterium GWD2_32_19]|nr:MAG: thiamine biosynthesis protein ThiJ [Clostridiales bacterium GWD2_32_19]